MLAQQLQGSGFVHGSKGTHFITCYLFNYLFALLRGSMGASAWSWRSGKPRTSVIFLPLVPWVLRPELRSPGSVSEKQLYQLSRHDSPRDSRHLPAHVPAQVPAHGSSFPTSSQMCVVNFFLMTAILTGVTQTFRTVLRCSSLGNEEVEWFLTYLGAICISSVKKDLRRSYPLY